MFAPAGRITARAGLRSKLAALVVRRQALAPWEPQRGSREVKKLSRAGVLHGSSRFFTSLRLTPSGAKINSMGVG